MELKQLDFQILSELMKNAKMSDRELSRKLGFSQATVSRRRAKLERNRIIKEYTFLPDFPKLGYHIMAITLLKYETNIDRAQVLEARKNAKEIVKASPFEMIMAERGIGMDYDGVTISFHKDYAAFVAFREWVKESLPTRHEKLNSFLVNLDDHVHFKPLTFSTLAKHLLKLSAE
jgi:DNA-binding Lrp family transcriptional regulator